MSVVRSVVKGCGSYLPDRILTNSEISKTLDTSDEWIVARTGIRERRIAADGEFTSDLALAAARNALASAGMEPGDIDLIVLATSTPDYTFPATAVIVQAGLGIEHGAAFDIQAVCSGFVYALATADNFLRAGSHKRALVIGAETYSRILDWQDRSTCVLFGDGAGALVLEAELHPGTIEDPGVHITCIRSDGRYRDKLYVDGGPSTTQTTGHLRMQGREVYRHAVVKTAEIINESLRLTGLSASDIDWFVPHQANKRILDSTAKKVGLPAEKVIITVERHANTSSASIPLALDEAVKDRRIRSDQLLLLEAMGGGFTWGSAIVRW
ncbi:MAG: beta-ketoacyl-ACP synthase III [Alphaproteobacteria bacterium]